ncbi:MAG TPA: LLM class flavin-dependent oxidoreductase [Acidimicrobiales bacterium]|nr:LLM class flavin-dependent oxidoreductase [Acidimicrobiales bacterium]
MRFGFVLPGGGATEQLEQAVLADDAGWDAVFVWEAAYGVDAWSLLAAMAAKTSRVRLGTMLTPLPWRRPWKVASQVATLDQLSGGRAILAVGLGAPDPALGTTGEVTDRRARAALLDEGIDVVYSLWHGDLEHHGPAFDVDLRPRVELFGEFTPVQQPHPPLWCVGAWPRPRSMRRVLRCDGWLPNVLDAGGEHRSATPDDVRAARAWFDATGPVRDGFDVIVEGETPADDAGAASAIVAPWADAGATWWLDARWSVDAADRRRVVEERLAAGPPRL